MKTITSIVLIMLLSLISFAQTEQEYFEKQRLERKDKKVKAKLTYGNDNTLDSKDHYDENGFLTKREIFYTSKPENIQYLYMEIFINNYDASGNISGNEILYEMGKKINEFPFNNMSYTYFYEIGFDENLIDDIKYIFDKNGNLIEKRFTSVDMYPPGVYEKEILIYDSNNLLIESRYSIPDNPSVNITKYFYNSSDLLEKSGEVRYEYEFY